ncbi:MAG: hypothetical protein WC667_02855 [Sulfurimonas sp.]|jgi:hypothetical protein
MKTIIVEILKRYSMALLFLLVVMFLMLISTIAVKTFGDKMSQEMGIQMKPGGEKINL